MTSKPTSGSVDASFLVLPMISWRENITIVASLKEAIFLLKNSGSWPYFSTLFFKLLVSGELKRIAKARKTVPKTHAHVLHT